MLSYNFHTKRYNIIIDKTIKSLFNNTRTRSYIERMFYMSDNFNNLNNPNGFNSEQNNQNPNTPNSFSYNYSSNNMGPGTFVDIEEKPKKKKHVFTKVVAFAVCAAVISAGSIQCYRYIDRNDIIDNFFSRPSSSDEKDDANDNSREESANSANSVSSSEDHGKSWLQLAAREDGMTIPEAVEEVMPAVVGISAEFTATTQYSGGWLFGQQQTETTPATGTGTGIVMTSDGYIITNAHVINDTEYGYGLANSVSVLLSDKTEYEATIKGYDEDTDIAVLKIDAKNLKAAEFGNSDDLKVGELVIAIGNPLGFELFGSVTCGIVSALNREITINDKNMSLIQTDAAINAGNSGGPLVNSYGQVIGINSAKMSTNVMSGNSASIEGLGFAIPMTQAQTIIDDLINYGYVKGRPQIGISVSDVDEYTASLYNMPLGVYVRSVTPNGAAEKAGIQPGDVIIGVNGDAISTSNELNKKKDEHNAGDTITLNISRNGDDIDVKVTLQEVTQGDKIFGNDKSFEN